jgi:hypothetical protein
MGSLLVKISWHVSNKASSYSCKCSTCAAYEANASSCSSSSSSSSSRISFDDELVLSFDDAEPSR